MKKTVSSGMRNATVNLGGEECAVQFSANFKYFEVFNESGGNVTASIYEGKGAGDDGVLTVHSGTSATLAHMRTDIDTVYVTGNGTVQIAAKNSGEPVFKPDAKGGEIGSEAIIKSYTVSASDHQGFKAWFDANIKPDIENIFDIKYESP
ncbi:MAG: hypothetical protein NC120_14185, partial [Ruminococcus sp.]|nr:hypothetical protein [Ruminococcus sp.]